MAQISVYLLILLLVPCFTESDDCGSDITDNATRSGIEGLAKSTSSISLYDTDQNRITHPDNLKKVTLKTEDGGIPNEIISETDEGKPAEGAEEVMITSYNREAKGTAVSNVTKVPDHKVRVAHTTQRPTTRSRKITEYPPDYGDRPDRTLFVHTAREASLLLYRELDLEVRKGCVDNGCLLVVLDQSGSVREVISELAVVSEEVIMWNTTLLFYNGASFTTWWRVKWCSELSQFLSSKCRVVSPRPAPLYVRTVELPRTLLVRSPGKLLDDMADNYSYEAECYCGGELTKCSCSNDNNLEYMLLTVTSDTTLYFTSSSLSLAVVEVGHVITLDLLTDTEVNVPLTRDRTRVLLEFESDSNHGNDVTYLDCTTPRDPKNKLFSVRFVNNTALKPQHSYKLDPHPALIIKIKSPRSTEYIFSMEVTRRNNNLVLPRNKTTVSPGNKTPPSLGNETSVSLGNETPPSLGDESYVTLDTMHVLATKDIRYISSACFNESLVGCRELRGSKLLATFSDSGVMTSSEQRILLCNVPTVPVILCATAAQVHHVPPPAGLERMVVEDEKERTLFRLQLGTVTAGAALFIVIMCFVVCGLKKVRQDRKNIYTKPTNNLTNLSNPTEHVELILTPG